MRFMTEIFTHQMLKDTTSSLYYIRSLSNPHFLYFKLEKHYYYCFYFNKRESISCIKKKCPL